MKNIICKLFLSVSFILLLSSCGYQVGSLMHPQVKTIAVAPIKNETRYPFLSAFMRGSLCEQYQLDGSLKVKQLDTADCIIFGRIIDVQVRGSSEDSYDGEQTYRAAEWNVRVTMEFVVMIPGRKKPLVAKRRVVGTANFQVMADQAITKRRGIQQACRDAAKKAVVYTTEAW